jgi:hypothetical protein
MDATAILILIATSISVLIALFLPFVVMSGKQWREAEDRARARRLADARMNARLLRLNI